MANEKVTDRAATATSTGGFLHIVKSLTSYKIAIENLFKTTAAIIFGGQAHSASYVKTFSASATFNANDGNNQKMAVTGDTTIALSNEQPGVFIVKLIISTGTPPTITIGNSFGDPLDNTPSFITANGDTNTITVVVDGDGLKEYTINQRTA